MLAVQLEQRLLIHQLQGRLFLEGLFLEGLFLEGLFLERLQVILIRSGRCFSSPSKDWSQRTPD